MNICVQIPVMFGGGDYSTLLPPHSYIDALHYPDPALLAAKLYSLLHDHALFSAYFSWRPHYSLATFHR